MNEKPHVLDVVTETFAETVIDESWKRPVMVDFWAAWCGPCRILGPILERLAAEFAGDFLLAKLDTEANPELAGEFGIRSIPNVKVFRDGEVVDELVGALPEPEVRRFLRRHCPSAADRKHAEARALLEAGDRVQAAAALDAALALEPEHPGALLEAGKLALADGDPARAEARWSRIGTAAPQWDEAQSLRGALQFAVECQAGGGRERAAERASATPGDLGARYAHACCLAQQGRYRDALEELLAVVARDREFREQAPRKAMLTIFTLVGERSALAEEYRKRLAQTLF